MVSDEADEVENLEPLSYSEPLLPPPPVEAVCRLCLRRFTFPCLRIVLRALTLQGVPFLFKTYSTFLLWPLDSQLALEFRMLEQGKYKV